MSNTKDLLDSLQRWSPADYYADYYMDLDDTEGEWVKRADVAKALDEAEARGRKAGVEQCIEIVRKAGGNAYVANHRIEKLLTESKEANG